MSKADIVLARILLQDVSNAIASLRRLLGTQPRPEPEDSGFRLGTRSLKRLQGVHPDILAVTHYAIRVSTIDFGIPRTGGVRSSETQDRLTAAGKSRAKYPRHVTGHAVDIAALDPQTGKSTWEPGIVLQVHEAFRKAAAALDVPLRWGGDWNGNGNIREKGENDLVHHELPRATYGNNKHSQSVRAAAYLEQLNSEALIA